MMEPEVEEPNAHTPTPSPHPSHQLRIVLDSAGLDLTPEKPKAEKRVGGRGKNRPPDPRPDPVSESRPSAMGGDLNGWDPFSPAESDVHMSSASKTQSRVASCDAGPESGTPSVSSSGTGLDVPQLNSTAPLYKRIQDLRQQKPKSIASRKLCENQDSESIMESISLPKPLKEVNVPRHVSRYSELVPVDVSEESFQKMATKPKRKELKESKKSSSPCPEEPCIMDFFSPDLEWEEAVWTVDKTAPSNNPLHAPSEATFLMYRAMYSEL